MSDEHETEAVAQQLRSAWQAGYAHGERGGSRSADPHIWTDHDLHLAWDEGWIAGGAARLGEAPSAR